MKIKSICCNYEFDVKYVSKDSLGYCTTCPCCHSSFDVSMRRLTPLEFYALKEGDKVFVRIHDTLVESEVMNRPFYNSDADEPDWEVETSNGFCDIDSLYKLNNIIEKGEDNMNNEKIKVELAGGGAIIVERNPDPDYDGVSVYFETKNRGIVSIVCVECKAENNYGNIDVYTYENELSDEFTRKYTLDKNKINESFE